MITRNEVYREPYPGKIYIAITLIHPGRGSPAPVSPLISLMSSVRMLSTSVSSSQGNSLSKRNFNSEEDNAGAAKGKQGSRRSEGVLRSRGKKWCSKSSKCWENDSDLRTTAGLQVPDG
jgi:hypothetical protein